MQHTKRIATGMTAVLAAVLLVVPASAHGGHHRQNQTSVQAQPAITTCSVCTTADCHITGRHSHNGVTYCGYDHADGFCDGSCTTTVQSNGHHGSHSSHGHH